MTEAVPIGILFDLVGCPWQDDDEYELDPYGGDADPFHEGDDESPADEPEGSTAYEPSDDMTFSESDGTAGPSGTGAFSGPATSGFDSGSSFDAGPPATGSAPGSFSADEPAEPLAAGEPVVEAPPQDESVGQGLGADLASAGPTGENASLVLSAGLLLLILAVVVPSVFRMRRVELDIA